MQKQRDKNAETKKVTQKKKKKRRRKKKKDKKEKERYNQREKARNQYADPYQSDLLGQSWAFFMTLEAKESVETRGGEESLGGDGKRGTSLFKRASN